MASGWVCDLGVSAGADARDGIIMLLAQKWPLTAKEIHNEIRKIRLNPITYQGVHKNLKQLSSEEIVVYSERKYSLDTKWIANLKKFSENTLKAYCRTAGGRKIEIGIGSSVENSAFLAGREAAEKAFGRIRQPKPVQLVLAFISKAYGPQMQEVMRGITGVTKKAKVAGMLTSGEINGKKLKNSVTVAVFEAEEGDFLAEMSVVQLDGIAGEIKRKSTGESGKGGERSPAFCLVLGPKTRTRFAVGTPVVSHATGRLYAGLAGGISEIPAGEKAVVLRAYSKFRILASEIPLDGSVKETQAGCSEETARNDIIASLILAESEIPAEKMEWFYANGTGNTKSAGCLFGGVSDVQAYRGDTAKTASSIFFTSEADNSR